MPVSVCVYVCVCCVRTVRRYQTPALISPNSPGQRSDVDCCSEDESDLDPGTKLVREKERRSANNQRERYVMVRAVVMVMVWCDVW